MGRAFEASPTIAGPAVPVDKHEVSTIRFRKVSDNTMTTTCLSAEIAESDDGNPVDNGTSQRPCPFVFDTFAEDDDNNDDRLAGKGPATHLTTSPRFTFPYKHR